MLKLLTEGRKLAVKLLYLTCCLCLMGLVVTAQLFIRFFGGIGFAGQPLNLFV